MKPDWSDVAIITLIAVVVFGVAISCAIHRGLQPYNKSNEEISNSLVKLQAEIVRQRVILEGLKKEFPLQRMSTCRLVKKNHRTKRERHNP